MIKQFQGEYRWLSNFVPCTITMEGFLYPSVENAYMSAKSNSIIWKRFCQQETAGNVKRKSREIELIDNWSDIKDDVMKSCLIQKFFQEPYKSKLIATKDEFIQEGNMWGDRYWGVCLKTGIGENRLGKMIMEIRGKIKENLEQVKL